MKPCILSLRDVRKTDLPLVGGKAANLGELLHLSLPVPEGFVITAEAYRLFLKENALDREISERPSARDTEACRNFASLLREKICQGSFPPGLEQEIREMCLSFGEKFSLAVRSSATAEDLPDASFAGQQESFLNVCSPGEVLQKTKECFASLWGERALSYRDQQNMAQENPSIAVVVQKMIRSEASGVLFTMNPLTGNREEAVINASFGLGESIVSGRVNADSYTVNKKSGEIKEQIGKKEIRSVYKSSSGGTEEVSLPEEEKTKRVLNREEILRLTETGQKIECLYGVPMDIEWAIAEGKLYVLQAREITAGGSDAKVEEYLKKVHLTRSMRKVMAFQLEKMPFAYRALDYEYMNIMVLQKSRIFLEGGIRLSEEGWIDDDGVQLPPDSRMSLTAGILRLPSLLRGLADLQGNREMCSIFLPKYEKEMKEMAELDFSSMTKEDLHAFLTRSFDLLQSLFYDRFRYAVFPAVFLSPKMTRIIRKANPEYTAFDLFRGLNNRTAVVAEDLIRMAGELRADKEFLKAAEAGKPYADLCEISPLFSGLSQSFLRKHGFKSDYNCYAIDAKTFLEDKDRLVQILLPVLKDQDPPEEGRGKEEYKAVLEKLGVRYGKRFPKIRKKIEAYRSFHYVREETQYLWECLFYHVRRCLEEVNLLLLGDRNYREGVSNLFFRELGPALLRGRLNAEEMQTLRRRREKHPLAEKVWNASKSLVFPSKGEVLKGVSGSAGIAAGSASVILSPEEFHKMKKGDIIVCHLTDPEWTPLFRLASAVVADTGSALSHAAIVAREFHIPAVLGVGYATERYKDGDLISVDGNKGIVRRVRDNKN